MQICADKAQNSGGLEHNPSHSVLLFQPVEIWRAEFYPVFLGLVLIKPLFSQRREHGNCSAIFYRVRQSAALGQSAKADGVLAGDFEVQRIYRENSICGSILPNPSERLGPGISGNAPRPFDVGTRGKQITLSESHAAGDGQKKYKPTPGVLLNDVFRDQASSEEQHENVKQMQAAQRLNAGKALKPLRNGDS